MPGATSILDWIILGASILAMYRIADAEGRSGVGWAAMTFAICIACWMTIPLPMINVALGFFISFIAMTVMKIVASRQ